MTERRRSLLAYRRLRMLLCRVSLRAVRLAERIPCMALSLSLLADSSSPQARAAVALQLEDNVFNEIET